MTETWGKEFLLVKPDYFGVKYSINPYMNPSNGVDRNKVLLQWHGLYDTMLTAGAKVKIAKGVEDMPDLVYAMNLGYCTKDADGKYKTLLSNMAFPERQHERSAVENIFEQFSKIETLGIKDRWEAGDAFPWSNDSIVIGTGPRTSLKAAKAVAEWTGRELVTLKGVNKYAYHLDLSFTPLPGARALVFPRAWSPKSWEKLKPRLKDYLVLSDVEALQGFAANSIVIGDTVLIPSGPNERVKEWLKAQGFNVKTVNVSEFHLGGGSLRCLVNSIDFPV